MDGDFAVKEVVVLKLFLFLNFLHPPPSSTRPHVIGCNDSHNASGTVQIYETNETNVVMESASSSSFAFTVAASNILGAGKESDITIVSFVVYQYIIVQSVYKITANKLDINQLNNKQTRSTLGS